jgi:hypothetical protein
MKRLITVEAPLPRKRRGEFTKLRLHPADIEALRFLFCDLETALGVRSSYAEMIERMRDGCPFSRDCPRCKARGERERHGRNGKVYFETCDYCGGEGAIATRMSQGGAVPDPLTEARKPSAPAPDPDLTRVPVLVTVGDGRRVWATCGITPCPPATTPRSVRWTETLTVHGGESGRSPGERMVQYMMVSGEHRARISRTYRALRRMAETSQGGRYVTVLHRVYGPKPSGLGSLRDHTSLEYVFGEGGADDRGPSELAKLVEYTTAASRAAEEYTRVAREIKARQEIYALERHTDGSDEEREARVARRAAEHRLVVTTGEAVRMRVTELTPARRDGEAKAQFDERRAQAKRELEDFVRRVKREAEQLLVAASNTFREAKGETEAT